MSLADEYKNSSIQWKVTNAQAEKADAEAKIGELAGFANDAINQYGATYIQIQNKEEQAPYYRAIVSRYGRVFLESQGFIIEELTTHANIWWAPPGVIEAAADAILNPPPVIEEPLPPVESQPADSGRPPVESAPIEAQPTRETITAVLARKLKPSVKNT